jgi:hypothetical protein
MDHVANTASEMELCSTAVHSRFQKAPFVVFIDHSPRRR